MSKIKCTVAKIKCGNKQSFTHSTFNNSNKFFITPKLKTTKCHKDEFKFNRDTPCLQIGRFNIVKMAFNPGEAMSINLSDPTL